MRFNNAKYMVLHVGCGNLHNQYKLGGVRVEHSHAEKTWEYWQMASWTLYAMSLCSPESRSYPGLQQKKHGQQGKEGDSTALLCAQYSSYLKYCIQIRVLSAGETQTWSTSRGEIQR